MYLKSIPNNNSQKKVPSGIVKNTNAKTSRFLPGKTA